MITLFSYGTLQQKEIQMDLFQKALEGTPDRLVRYRMTAIVLPIGYEKFMEYPAIMYSGNSNDVISGVCFQITDHDLLKADEYEGDAYKRIEVVLESGQRAWAYVAATSDSEAGRF